MRIDDTDFEEILALLPQENVPSDPIEARQTVEGFVDLVELLARPLSLRAPTEVSLKQPSSVFESKRLYLSHILYQLQKLGVAIQVPGLNVVDEPAHGQRTCQLYTFQHLDMLV